MKKNKKTKHTKSKNKQIKKETQNTKQENKISNS